MHRNFLVCVLVLASANLAYSKDAAGTVDLVNPLVGSDSEPALSNGNTYPAIAVPWGMNFWTPVTNPDRRSGWAYNYDDYKIRHFKQTHQPSPWINDYGVFALMPMTGAVKFSTEDRGSWFSHKSEISKPHYYRVYLADYDLTTEITPTDRAAQFRFTYPKSEAAALLVDAYGKGNWIKIIPEERKIVGTTKYNTGAVPDNFKTYFVLIFDRAFDAAYTWKDGTAHEDQIENQGQHVQAVVQFATATKEAVNIKVASSFISLEQAELNLQRELGSDSFDQTCEKAAGLWNQKLNRIEIEGATLREKRTFYTALYRTLLFPRKFYEFDKDNTLVHYSPYNGEVLPGYMFTDNGFWDTFRAVFPFFTLMFPELNSQIMSGLVNTYKESGWLPEWASPGHTNCMIGSNSASIIADSYLKGIRGYDIETLFEAILKNSENEGPMTSVGRYGVDYYNTLGYIPYDVGINENVARTLEYSYDDFAIWQLAMALDKEPEVVKTFEERAQYYKNVFDASTNFMRGRNQDGTFQSPFVPEKWGDAFTEGCAWHYTWCVFQDPRGLINLMGGREAFVEKLDSVFTAAPTFDYSYYGSQIHEITEMLIANMGQYAHGNQPIQHAIYLYNYAGQPWKAQQRAREVMARLYSPDPDGLCGDEDNGQTSAWYVFSAMGMYPVCPGASEYVQGSPLFEKITLHLENGKDFVVTAKNNSGENIYIQSAKLNKKRYSKTYLSHKDIMKGGRIDYVMGPRPNTSRGTTQADAPYSMSTVDFVAPPFVAAGDVTFLDSTQVTLACQARQAQIRYTLDGSEPGVNSLLYTEPVTLTATTTLKAKAFAKDLTPSPTLTHRVEKAELLPPAQVQDLVPGLKFQYFEGRFRSVTQMRNPVKTGTVKQIDLSMRNRDDYFGVIYDGYLAVPADGMYTFYLASDDGSQLVLDDTLIIDNDGPHGANFVQGRAALAKGMHKLRIPYFEGAVTEEIYLEWSGPNLPREAVPAEALFMTP
jgi:predicted alpha-1,2-mannosidase